MDADIISHVRMPAIEEAVRTCENIKSRKDPKKPCANPATHGAYCGLHFKHPHPWTPPSPKHAAAAATARAASVNETVGARVRCRKGNAAAAAAAAAKVQGWWRLRRGLSIYRIHGPAGNARDLCVNDSDFFSTDALVDISGIMFFSYADTDGRIYGFDVRSLHTLLYRARQEGEAALNPYTRAEVPTKVARDVSARVRWLTRRRLPTEWAPLLPPTPDQRMRMKVVDLFAHIDSLSYYSSPDWFIGLDARGQRRFYAFLYDIWAVRAGLSIEQKSAMVPQFPRRIFRTPLFATRTMELEELQRLNLSTIRVMTSSASDREDRVLGAMYVISALTLVCAGAQTAYPWLYESVADGVPAPAVPAVAAAPVVAAAAAAAAEGGLLRNGLGWLIDLLAAAREEVPPLELPPRA